MTKQHSKLGVIMPLSISLGGEFDTNFFAL